MIQFKFDHRYVSDIDQVLKSPSQDMSAPSSEPPPENARTTMALLPEDALPFSLKKRDDDPKPSL